MAPPLITLRDATVAHADGLPPALHEVSLTVARGDWIAIVGANGSGKTTLLAALGGVLPLRSGHIDRPVPVRTALLLQEPDNQFVASSVRRELALSIPGDVTDGERSARIAAAIDRFDLGALLERSPHRLSGGEQQRLALATVWLENPDVLLLDEPLSYLDDEMRARVIAFVRELNSRGVAILWATPGGGDVALAQRAIVLDGGRMSLDLVDSRAYSQGLAPSIPPELASLARREPCPSPPAREQSLLCFESVSFAYDHRPVLAGVNFRATPGECIGVEGKNGSGKSTLLLLAGGALHPSSGRVTRHTREHGVLFLPQSPERLFFAETVEEEVCFGLVRRGVSKAEARERGLAALRQASLDPGQFASRSPFELSFGEMRRVAFAVAFALEPELLLLDEPASCLDFDGRAVLERLARQSAAGGAAVLEASHEDMRTRGHDRVLTVHAGSVEEPAKPPISATVDAGHPPR